MVGVVMCPRYHVVGHGMMVIIITIVIITPLAIVGFSQAHCIAFSMATLWLKCDAPGTSVALIVCQ